MAVSLAAIGTGSGTNGTAPAPTLPTGLVSGDVMLLFVYTREVTDGTISTPTGWTPILAAGGHRSSGGLMQVFWRVWQSGDTAPTVTLTNHTTGNSGDSAIAIIARVTGANTTVPIKSSTSPTDFASSATVLGNLPAFTPGDHCAVVAFGGHLDNDSAATFSGGDGLTWANRFQTPNANGSDNMAVGSWASNTAGTNLSSGKSWTISGAAAAVGKGMWFAINEAGFGGDVTPPVPTIVSTSGSRISAQATKDSIDVTWSSDEAFTHYMLRVVSNASDVYTAGSLIEQDQNPASGGTAGTQYTSTITEAELVAASAGDGDKIVKLFTQDAAGNWST